MAIGNNRTELTLTQPLGGTFSSTPLVASNGQQGCMSTERTGSVLPFVHPPPCHNISGVVIFISESVCLIR